ncbi:PAS domain-containing sensor histidine kinase [Rugamonas sp.]|uniref:hybrid sensor histidine kinase/response regulator n=1 Tax=Rugamonas sp. TaxID=1926287 RepID=UPI0025EB2C8A|nr:PAS domain-containing sensor histidine kinase [Rugamonas sp.]
MFKDHVSNDNSSERRFQLLIGSINDYAIFMLDLEGHVTSWNPGAERFKGYRAEEIIGRHFSLFYTDEERAAGVPVRALKEARELGKFEAEGWRVRKDGTHFWANVVIDPVRDDGGQLIGFAKITRDMSKQRAAQLALRDSEERFRLLVQGVTDYAIYMLSPTGTVTNWNSGAERIKGYQLDDVVGTHFSRFYTEADRAKGVPEHALNVALTVGRYEQEGLRVRKDGSQFWAHVVIDAIHDPAGKLLGFAKVTRDITERKLAAEALERANAALFQSQKMEAIGQLTGGIAHDFNNLLAVLSSSLDILGIRLHETADRRLLEGMHRAVNRGVTLTQQLLSFARQQPLKVDNYNLNDLIEGFETMLRRAGASGIAYTFDLAPNLGNVAIDATRFEAALLNLVVNARDAMEDSGNIFFSTANVELLAGQVGQLAAGPYVRTTVKDSGAGMSAAVIARAFEPFFTTKDVGKGTGLGLSQVYGFIAQSGGDVTLESQPGLGTTVDIFLPIVAQAEALTPDAEPVAERVLIVEDEADLMTVASELFSTMGYQVFTASNGNDALLMLNRMQDIEILFTDVMMPNGMNGIELARTAQQRYPKLKVILASGYALPALLSEYGDLSDFSLLSKPYRLADLAKKLRGA